MNDFTKEELQLIYDNSNPCVSDEMRPILDKTKLMIDNYCEHDPRDTFGPIGMYHCPVCGDMQVAGFRHVKVNNDN